MAMSRRTTIAVDTVTKYVDGVGSQYNDGTA
jgi:hypothetical protein